LYRLFSGDINDVQAFEPVIDALDVWRRNHGTTVILVTHLRKRQNGSSSRPTMHDVYGTASISWSADTIMIIQRRRDGQARLYFEKDREGELPQGHYWDLLYDNDHGFSP